MNTHVNRPPPHHPQVQQGELTRAQAAVISVDTGGERATPGPSRRFVRSALAASCQGLGPSPCEAQSASMLPWWCVSSRSVLRLTPLSLQLVPSDSAPADPATPT
ncbi:unnamed protein product [Pleuronectes platessa]|uniref:Uncharacterized protein n=1 Tax=Pleuronectes platessa TaxID=8262 RepID=A0A9N7V881_PLEPL|nr:unnamed protein product [Pleuronectes platessa]